MSRRDEESTTEYDSFERIIEAAEHCFLTNGYHGTHIRIIAEKAEVSESLVRYHFDNREQLFFIVLDSLLRATKKNIHLRTVGKPQGIQTILEAFEVIGESLDRWAKLIPVFEDLRRSDSDHQRLVKRRNEFALQAQKTMEESFLQAAGGDVSLLPIPPNRLSSLILSSLHGIAFTIYWGDPDSAAQQFQDLKTLLERSIK